VCIIKKEEKKNVIQAPMRLIQNHNISYFN